MTKYLSEQQVVQMLKDAQGGYSQVQFAEKLKISQQMLSDVVRGRRRLPEKVLEFLGVEPVEQLYRRRVK